MKVQELLIWFEANKTQNKNDLSNNVHKVYEAYRNINNDYINLDISIIVQNIDTLYNSLVEKYKPITVRNYIRYLLHSFDLPIIINNVSPEIITNSKEKCKKFVQMADKKVNQSKSEIAATISEENESESMNINEIIPIENSISEISNNENDDLLKLQIENKMLKDEVAWLRKIVELMASK